MDVSAIGKDVIYKNKSNKIVLSTVRTNAFVSLCSTRREAREALRFIKASKRRSGISNIYLIESMTTVNGSVTYGKIVKEAGKSITEDELQGKFK